MAHRKLSHMVATLIQKNREDTVPPEKSYCEKSPVL